MIASKKAEGLAAGLAAEDLGGEAEGGWGDDDLKLDDEEDGGEAFENTWNGNGALSSFRFPIWPQDEPNI